MKCDRGQPECGRCIFNGIQCIYGVSRKMGKPPRHRPTLSRGTSTDRPGSTGMGQLDSGSGNAGDIMQDVEPFLNVTDMSTAWNTVDDNPAKLAVSLDALDGLYGILSGSSLPNLAPHELGDWTMTDSILAANLQPGPLSTPESPYWDSCPSTGPRQHQAEKSSHPDGASTSSSGTSGSHDCAREAYEILESLSFLSLSKAHSATLSSASSSSAAGGSANRVPLDHVLRVNRETSERLAPLLSCSCARSPHLALLYASIISRTLVWYQQAASCCMQSAPWNRATSSGSAVSPAGASCASASTQPAGPSVVKAKMAIGTFNVDDPRVQTALEIQLLSAEIRRAGHLIDQFLSHYLGSQGSTAEESTSYGVKNLYQSLNSWLRTEHARITQMMASKLSELNT